jgi:AcrR family transcriptional regulator
MPSLTRTQKRQQETRERIFRVAMELFKRKGFENTTVAEITEAADIGKGTFFTYFPTKEAIFRQPGETAMEDMLLAAQEGLEKGKTVAKILKSVMTVSAAWHEANKDITQQMSKSSFVFSMDNESSNKGKLLELLVQLIVAGQKSGEFNSEINVQDAAIVMVGMYFTVLAFWSYSDKGSLRTRMESSVDVILKGLQA